MGIEYTESASRHGISEQDARYVIRHATTIRPIKDRYGRPAKAFIGPLHAQTDRLAEVFAHFNGRDFVIFHAQETGERA